MTNRFVGLGALNAFIAVAAGAFAAHGLKNSITPDSLSVFKTAANYQMMHALGLILIGLLSTINPHKTYNIAGWFMFTGIIIFSGSLYILSLSGIRWLGMITPVGGLCFLIAWLILCKHTFFTNRAEK